jgi:hypothetical protein
MRKTAARLLAVVLTLAACTVLLEVGLRIAGRSPSNTVEGFFVQHGESYRLRPNMTKVVNWPSYSYVAITDSFGFRDRQTGDRHLEDRKYDLFVGSSATFGNGVDYDESFAGVYEDLSRRGDGIEVLNLAVGGHRFRDQLQLLREFTDSVKERPRKVFICLDPNLLSTIDTIDTGIIVKDGYLFRRDRWLPAYLKVTVANVSAVYCFLRDSVRAIQAKQGAGIESQLQGFLDLYAVGIIPSTCDAYLDEMTDLCRGLGAEPVYVYLQLSVDYALQDALRNGRFDAGRYDLGQHATHLESYCRQLGLRCIDCRPVLAAFAAGGNALSFAMDAHYNEATCRIVGEYLSRQASSSSTDGGRTP